MTLQAAPTITPEYAALNADLHQRQEKYGAGAHRKALPIIEAMGEYDCADILDYGCGKGTLAKSLPGVTVSEYDPAIPGKDAAPGPADLVTCLDVLEHVEPHLLENVLAELSRLSRKAIFLIIATRPSTQTLSDGRNAHLIIEDADWWRNRLIPHLLIDGEEVLNGEYVCWGRPLSAFKEPPSKMAVSNAVRAQYTEANCARVAGRIGIDGPAPEHGRRAVLACFGPSLGKTVIDILNQVDEPGVDIFTVSAAHRYCIDRGIIPHAQMDCDPRPHKVTQMGDAHPDVRYWLASCVHPSYIDHVSAGRETALWHAYNGEDSHRHLSTIEPRSHMVIGGGSIGLRALSLLYCLGYRKVAIHGMDFSFADDDQHAGEHHGKRKSVVDVVLPDGRVFKSSPALMIYYRHFFQQLLWMGDCSISLRGDGMLQHAMRIANAGRN